MLKELSSIARLLKSANKVKQAKDAKAENCLAEQTVANKQAIINSLKAQLVATTVAAKKRKQANELTKQLTGVKLSKDGLRTCRTG